MRNDNAIKKLWNRVTIEQWYKFLRVVIICMVFMVISEGIFEIPAVADFFGEGLIAGKSGWIVYVLVWLVMYLQVAVIPIPALPILTACNQIEGLVGSDNSIMGLFSWNTVIFLAICVSATMLGAITAYWIGRKFGKRAVKWVAGSEEDYNLWSEKLNTKTGKFLYAATVYLPVFPDDLIAIVVGSIKMNFAYYCIVNLTGKIVGLFCMLLFMRIPGISAFFGNSTSNIPFALICYVAILLAAIIAQNAITRRINREQPKTIKLDAIKDELMYYINKVKSESKDLIIDYKFKKKLRTYLAGSIYIHTYYTVNNKNEKEKVRILIDCKINSYKQIIFDKEYKLTESYSTLIKDIENCKLY